MRIEGFPTQLATMDNRQSKAVRSSSHFSARYCRIISAAVAPSPAADAACGEGRWTVFEAVDLDVPAPIITLSLQQRFISRQQESYAYKLLAAMRNQFGGHAIKKAEK
jgi:hypothetical protein